jgi:hypothetical protein
LIFVGQKTKKKRNDLLFCQINTCGCAFLIKRPSDGADCQYGPEQGAGPKGFYDRKNPGKKRVLTAIFVVE